MSIKFNIDLGFQCIVFPDSCIQKETSLENLFIFCEERKMKGSYSLIHSVITMHGCVNSVSLQCLNMHFLDVDLLVIMFFFIF